MKKSSSSSHPKEAEDTQSAAQHIDEKIAALDDWRGPVLVRIRKIILAAGPQIIEEWKWGVPVWSCNGIICTGETYKSAVKMTFAKGASLEDPSGLFNSSLEGNVRRAIDVRADEKIDEKALQALVRAAAELNASAPAAKKKAAASGAKKGA